MSERDWTEIRRLRVKLDATCRERDDAYAERFGLVGEVNALREQHERDLIYVREAHAVLRNADAASVEDAIRAELIALGVSAGVDVMARRVPRRLEADGLLAVPDEEQSCR